MYFEYFIYHIVLKISLLEIKQILRSTYQEKESTVFLNNLFSLFTDIEGTLSHTCYVLKCIFIGIMRCMNIYL